MKEVLIIGAGPAGLTAAYELAHRDGYHVTVLEESCEMGGISRTICHHGNYMDIGGHRFFSKDERVNAWWREIFPDQGAPSLDDRLLERNVALHAGGPDPEHEDEVMLIRHRVSHIYYNHRFFDYPVSMNGSTIRNMGLVTTLEAGFSYLYACVHKEPEDSLEHFYINRFGRKLYSMFFESYTEKLWGRHPSEISADWGAQRVKGLSILALLKNAAEKLLPGSAQREMETSLIESFRYPKYGPGQLWQAAARRVKQSGGEIVTGCRVTGLTREGNRIGSVSCERDGKTETRRADIVISTMPIKDLVAGMNDVPQDIRAIADGLPYRDFVTVGLLVSRLAIRSQTKEKTLGGMVPDCWIYVQDKGVDMGRIQIFNNWSPYMVEDPQHTIWLGLEYFCAQGDALWCMSDADWSQKACAELKKMGVLAPDETVHDAHVERVKKAYPAYFDTYAQMDTLRTYLEGIENLYCIGRNGQHRYNNMDHSMATAFAAVDHIVSGNPERAAIWNVNTEKSYHEEKES